MQVVFTVAKLIAMVMLIVTGLVRLAQGKPREGREGGSTSHELHIYVFMAFIKRVSLVFESLLLCAKFGCRFVMIFETKLCIIFARHSVAYDMGKTFCSPA